MKHFSPSILLLAGTIALGQTSAFVLKAHAPYAEKEAPTSALTLCEVEWLCGTWRGAANQFNDHSKWTIVLTRKKGSKYCRIEYPSIGCYGHLELLSVSGKRVELRERITTGNCVQSVRLVIAKISSKKAYYRAYWPSDDHLNAEGILQKAK